jgi:hypothetical protein
VVPQAAGKKVGARATPGSLDDGAGNWERRRAIDLVSARSRSRKHVHDVCNGCRRGFFSPRG